MRCTVAGLALGVTIALTGCDRGTQPGPQATRPPGWIDVPRLLQADEEPENWLTLGRDFGESHNSPLAQINVDSIRDLGFAWEYEATSQRGRVEWGMEATPIVIDGVMYVSGPWGTVHAIDARTGAPRWRYDPDVDGSWARRVCCGVVNRGVQVWQGRVYVGTTDGYLVALDARDGSVAWKVDTLIDRTRPYAITGAPRIAKDKVVIGNAGADFGVRGYVSAYDARTGVLAWRFFTVPGDPRKGFEHPELEFAARTWDPDSLWEAGGGGTAWDAMAYDPEIDLLYVGTGNASIYPHWLRSPDGGDNLFLASILALDPDTGRLRWHYQTTPGESWDYTATQHMILADLEIGGTPRKVLLQAPKNGFFYVLDRVTGEPLSAEKLVTVTWASHVDLETGRPVVSPGADYRERPRIVAPGTPGAHNWPPMSFSPLSGLVYLTTLELPMLFVAARDFEYRPGELNKAALALVPPFAEPYARYMKEYPRVRVGESLRAWDPTRQREAWSVPLEGFGNGGTLSTAGNLVFQGTPAGQLVVYRADDGERLLEIEVGTAITAGPMSYAIDGAQYVAVAAGYPGYYAPRYPPGSAPYRHRNYGRILAFKLGGGEVPRPPPAEAADRIPQPPVLDADAGVLKRGETLFTRHCRRCHGARGARHRSAFPDLFRMAPQTYEAFEDIVLGGTLSAGGMASYADLLTREEAATLRAYLAEEQRALRSSSEVPAEG